MKKILCDCTCKGPYCDSFTHQCDKPNEHYSQREKVIADIRNQAITDCIEEIEKLKGGTETQIFDNNRFVTWKEKKC